MEVWTVSFCESQTRCVHRANGVDWCGKDPPLGDCEPRDVCYLSVPLLASESVTVLINIRPTKPMPHPHRTRSASAADEPLPDLAMVATVGSSGEHANEPKHQRPATPQNDQNAEESQQQAQSSDTALWYRKGLWLVLVWSRKAKGSTLVVSKKGDG